MAAAPAGWKLECVVPARAAEAVVAALEPMASAVGWFEHGAEWRIAAYGYGGVDAALLGAALGEAALAAGIAPPAADIVQLPAIDWLAQNRASFVPSRVGRFFINDSNFTGPPPAAAIPLLIDAATAFGSGTHATTRGCLHALSHLARRAPPGAVLDLGCGSGILAIAAAKLLRRPVLAVDIDPEAVRVTRRNVRRNGVAGLVRCVRADGYRHAAIDRAAPYALVLANILAGPLARMAYELSRHLAPRGIAVLSGLLATQETRVLAPHLPHRLGLRHRLRIDDWVDPDAGASRSYAGPVSSRSDARAASISSGWMLARDSAMPASCRLVSRNSITTSDAPSASRRSRCTLSRARAMTSISGCRRRSAATARSAAAAWSRVTTARRARGVPHAFNTSARAPSP